MTSVGSAMLITKELKMVPVYRQLLISLDLPTYLCQVVFTILFFILDLPYLFKSMEINFKYVQLNHFVSFKN